MAQDLTVNIKTTSDVPQAMEKAKAATNGFNKQVEDIGKKFSTSFKDIFLSFLGPMALLTGAIALIGKLIADNQKRQEEANQSAIDGSNKLMSAEDRYYARKREKEEQSKQDIEEAKEQRITTTREFLQNDPRAAEIFGKDVLETQRKRSWIGMKVLADVAEKPNVQEKVFKIIAQDIKNNPEAGDAISGDGKSDTFKGPQGFSSVVGVGANPVMEAMTKQLEEQQKQTALLEKIANGSNGVPDDFTKNPHRDGYGDQM
jgi:hypothetical protein